MSKGFIFYEGPSCLDGNPIVGIGTWGTTNEKTGNMLQTWILRSDITPVEAVKTGEDYSICGDCRWRHVTGDAPVCYVQRFHAPRIVYDSYSRGKYKYRFPDKIMEIPVRLGSYGDPFAIPIIVWDRLLERLHSKKWNGYTQFWKKPEAIVLQKYCMASVATKEEAAEAQEMGWRTYRMSVKEDTPTEKEIECPHYTHKVQCNTCNLCSGNKIKSGKSIMAFIHGVRAPHFVKWTKDAQRSNTA